MNWFTSRCLSYVYGCSAIVFCAVLFYIHVVAHGQQTQPKMMQPPAADAHIEDSAPEMQRTEAVEAHEQAEIIREHTDTELKLSYAVLIFGGLIMAGHFLIMFREHRYYDNMSLKILAMVLSLTGALFLITAGFSNTQIQPIIPIITGILGYAFGVHTEKPSRLDPKPPQGG